MLETIDNDSLLSMFLFQWENELHTYILDHHSVVDIMRQQMRATKKTKSERNCSSSSNEKSELTPLSRTMTISCTHAPLSQTDRQSEIYTHPFLIACRWSVRFRKCFFFIYFSFDFAFCGFISISSFNTSPTHSSLSQQFMCTQLCTIAMLTVSHQLPNTKMLHTTGIQLWLHVKEMMNAQ